jgi:hypothetical protein
MRWPQSPRRSKSPDHKRNFLAEPAERFYGVEATMRDNSGNWFSVSERIQQRATPTG